MSTRRAGFPTKLFYSYTHSDNDQQVKMEEFLAQLRRMELVSSWSDKDIVPGQSISETTKEKMRDSDVVAFLFSAAFINSSACMDEWDYAKHLCESGDLFARIPVVLSYCAWKDVLGDDDVLVLPKDGEPVSSFNVPDRAWLQVYDGIKRVAEEIRSDHRGRADPHAEPSSRENPEEANRIRIRAVCTNARDRTSPETAFSSLPGAMWSAQSYQAQRLVSIQKDRRKAMGTKNSSTESEWSISADGMDQFAQKINPLLDKVDLKQKDEFFYLDHYVRKGAGLSFPLTVRKHEFPDFVIEEPNRRIGLEMTSVVSEYLMENESEYKKHRPNFAHFLMPKTYRANMKFIDNLEKGLTEHGSALGRAETEIDREDVEEYARQVQFRLKKKLAQVDSYEFPGQIHLVIGIESTAQHNTLAWHPYRISMDMFVLLLDCLAKIAIEEVEKRGNIPEIVFLGNTVLFGVRKDGKIYCSTDSRSGMSVEQLVLEWYGKG